MAQRTIITDDITGEDGAETVTFGFLGKTWAIDLTPESQNTLAELLRPYITAGKIVTGNARVKTDAPPSTSNPDGPRARRWALATKWKHPKGSERAGKPASTRGRIHPEVIEAWIAAGRP